MTVHVVGNVTEDLVFSLSRLPRAGETIIASERLADIGGKGLNQAVLLARAGCNVKLVAAVGADAAGERALALVRAELPGSQLVTVDAPDRAAAPRSLETACPIRRALLESSHHGPGPTATKATPHRPPSTFPQSGRSKLQAQELEQIHRFVVERFVTDP